jgi:hypothetical protein
MNYFSRVLALLLLLASSWLGAQDARLTGTVTDSESGKAIELANVYLDGGNQVAESQTNGSFELLVPSGIEFTLVCNRLGYKEFRLPIPPLAPGSRRRIEIRLVSIESDVEIIVRESRLRDDGMIRQDVEALRLLPTTTGNLESVLPHIALGVSSGTGGELSSQYNVRGGNYDENLVYVNDFEIYRPQLIRAGQQEGLSFPNIDLIRDLSFSSGGFEARYGDKLSSVLDIKYKRPDSLRASVGLSFLGGSAHVEGSAPLKGSKYRKFRYLVGTRYKTTRYLLGTLDIEGEYVPNFTDIQGYFTFDLRRDWQLGILANINRSEYQFRPQSRSTAFGQIDFALQLFSVFEGQEVDDFTTSLGGLSLTYLPERKKNPFFLKFLTSAYRSQENERFDIIGRYSLRQIETNLGSDDFGDVIAELGSGTQQQFVRNYLQATVVNAEHKGGIELQGDSPREDVERSHFLQWSVRYQFEHINDRINEWERLDSAGYSLPYDPEQVLVFYTLKTTNLLQSSRLSASFQDTYTWMRDSVGEIRASFGVRATYWTLNQDLNVSPRAQLMYRPIGGKDIVWRLATGLYYQPPFYRELRTLQGLVNTDVVAQKSAHILGGFSWDFYMKGISDKKFRFITELYYKRLWDMISYDIENVRIRYSGFNDAGGYVTGIDLRINGEFVPGAESWINLSFLRAREFLYDVQHLRREIGEREGVPVSDVPRPTDQFMTLAIFFQDYLPRNENFKMHLNLTLGTGLPYGLPNNNRIYRNTYRFPPYHRVDIGFSVLLWNEMRRLEKPKHPLRFSRNAWLSLEVFNLLDVQNVASNVWIKTIFNQQYAIPNYLTSRRINLRLRFDF